MFFPQWLLVLLGLLVPIAVAVAYLLGMLNGGKVAINEWKQLFDEFLAKR